MILLVFVLPLLAGLLSWWIPRNAPGTAWASVVASLPALLLVCGWLQVNGDDVAALFLGASFSLQPSTSIFLMLAGILWLAAGLFSASFMQADSRMASYRFFFFLAMAGNMGLIVAADVVSFYCFFALMTFSSYGLVIHKRSDAALRAGRIYIIMAIAGELMLITAIYYLVVESGSILLADFPVALATMSAPDWIYGLALAGFGVKAGAIPLYFWLPLAHPVAPAPASAVLSGSMIKAGLIGWMHVAPLGLVTWPGWSEVLIILGITAALGAVAIGILQCDPKTVLAYSSISQMGLMTVLLGLGHTTKIEPIWLATALAFFALNHGLAKGALFMGAGLAAEAEGRQRWLLAAGMAVAAALLAGAPWTGGAVAKYALKSTSVDAPSVWSGALPSLLFISSMATTLLLGRYLVQCFDKGQPARSAIILPKPLGAWIIWLVLVIAASAVPLVVVIFQTDDTSLVNGLSPSAAWQALIPFIIGCTLLVATARYLPFVFKNTTTLVPPGDFIVVLEWMGRKLRLRASALHNITSSLGRSDFNFETLLYHLMGLRQSQKLVDQAENTLTRFPVAGLLFFGLLVVMIFILL